MSRALLGLSLGLGIALAMGCNPQAPPAANVPANNPTPSDEGRGKVHVDAPGVHVDVQGRKDTERRPSVDMEVKPRQP